MVWKEDQTIPLSQGLIQNKALPLFSSMKDEKGEAPAEERFEASRGLVHEVYGKKPFPQHESTR